MFGGEFTVGTLEIAARGFLSISPHLIATQAKLVMNDLDVRGSLNVKTTLRTKTADSFASTG